MHCGSYSEYPNRSAGRRIGDTEGTERQVEKREKERGRSLIGSGLKSDERERGVIRFYLAVGIVRRRGLFVRFWFALFRRPIADRIIEPMEERRSLFGGLSRFSYQLAPPLVFLRNTRGRYQPEIATGFAESSTRISQPLPPSGKSFPETAVPRRRSCRVPRCAFARSVSLHTRPLARVVYPKRNNSWRGWIEHARSRQI